MSHSLVQHNIRYGPELARHSPAAVAWWRLRQDCRHPRRTATTLGPCSAIFAKFVKYTHKSRFPITCTNLPKVINVPRTLDERRIHCEYTRRSPVVGAVDRARLRQYANSVERLHTDYVKFARSWLVDHAVADDRVRPMREEKLRCKTGSLRRRCLMDTVRVEVDAQWSTTRGLDLYRWHTSADGQHSDERHVAEAAAHRSCGNWNYASLWQLE